MVLETPGDWGWQQDAGFAVGLGLKISDDRELTRIEGFSRSIALKPSCAVLGPQKLRLTRGEVTWPSLMAA